MDKKFKRIIVIAPTQNTCLDISSMLSDSVTPTTLLTRSKGKEIFEAVEKLNQKQGGFGIVAPIGAGKTAAIRDIVTQILREKPRVEIVLGRNVLVTTPETALLWFNSNRTTGSDLVVIDDINQTSETLELVMALAKRVGCEFVWTSVDTVDPAYYSGYLNAREVISYSVYEPNQFVVSSVFISACRLRRMVLTCARFGINLLDLELITPVDHEEYVKEIARFKERKIIEVSGELTVYGKKVECLPVDSRWAEALVRAKNSGSMDLFTLVAVVSCIPSLYSLVLNTPNFDGVVVSGSDHLTSYNIIVAALQQFGYTKTNEDGATYGFHGDWTKNRRGKKSRSGVIKKGIFTDWAEKNGFCAEAIKEVVATLGLIYRQMGVELLAPKEFVTIESGESLHNDFVSFLARIQSLDFVRNKKNSQVRIKIEPAKYSVTNAKRVLGIVRQWKDTNEGEYIRATIEGTEITNDLMRRYATEKKFSRITGMTPDGNAYKCHFLSTFAGEFLSEAEEEVEISHIPKEFMGDAQEIFIAWLTDHLMNSEAQTKAKALNIRAGKDIFHVRSYEEIEKALPCVIGDAKRMVDINPKVIEFPSFNDEKVRQLLIENPDTILVDSLEFFVEYQHEHYPRITIKDDLALNGFWMGLPDEGVKLPGGRDVEVVVDFGYGNSISGCNTKTLKTQARNHPNQKQWDDLVKIDITLYNPQSDTTVIVPEIITATYGKCVVTGESLVAYGAAQSSQPSVVRKVVWCRTLEEAKKIQSEEIRKLTPGKEFLPHKVFKSKGSYLCNQYFYASISTIFHRIWSH